jgi:hypothetical protein
MVLRSVIRRLACVLAAAVCGPAAAAHAALPAPAESVASGLVEVVGPSAAVTAAGQVFVAWAAKSPPSGYEVFVARRPVAGARSTPAPAALDGVRVTSLGTNTAPSLAAAALPGGGAAVLVASKDGLYLWEIAPGGEVGQRETLYPYGLSIHDVKVDGAGRVFVAHRVSYPYYSERLSIRNPDRSVVSGLALGDDEYSGWISLAVGPAGGMATWAAYDFTSGKTSLRARRFTPVALSGTVLNVLPFGDGPQVAVGPGGEAVITYTARDESTTPPGPARLYALRSGADDQFVTGARISSNLTGAGDASAGKAVFDASGAVVVAFDQVMPTGRMAFVSRWLPSGNMLGPTPALQTGNPVVGPLVGDSALLTVTDAQGRLTPWLSGASTAPGASVPFAGFPGAGPGLSALTGGADAAGDVVAVFRRTTADVSEIGLTFLDGAAPTLGAVMVPANAVAGTPVAVGAEATDIVGPTTVTWDFGDGTPVTSAGTHTYAAAGTYTVTARATDGAGNAATAQRVIAVSAAPSPDPPRADPPRTVPPTTKPAATPIAVVRQFKVAPAARGKRVVSLIVLGAEARAKVTVVCRAGCPKRGKTIATKRAGKRTGDVTLALKKGSAPAGAELEVRVARTGKATRYARFKLLAKLPFLKRLADGCTPPTGRTCSG